MSDDQRTDGSRSTSRRSTLQALGTLLAAGGVTGAVTAQQDDSSYQITQADQTTSVEPLSGDVPVEEWYSYRLPEEYAGVGVHDVDGGPYYESVGTQSLQREATSITFLYDGPGGLHFVTVHGMATEDGDGGAVTWDVVVDAEDASWLVRDDEYWDPETGERPASNLDNWHTDSDHHRIDWTWSAQANDGGVLGPLTPASGLLIDPAYNEAATLYGERYTGTVTDWHFLSGDAADPDRYALALDEPLAITGPDAPEGFVSDSRERLAEASEDDFDDSDRDDVSGDETTEADDAQTETDTGDDDAGDYGGDDDDDGNDDDDDGDDDETEAEIEVDAEDEDRGETTGPGNGKNKGRGKAKGHGKKRGNGHDKGRGNGHGD
jgi:hypothetical protein